MNRLVIAVGALVALTGCGGNGGSADEPPATKPAATATSETFAVYGTLELRGDAEVGAPVGSPCSGAGGYDDIHGGAQVVVRDATSKEVGLGELADGMRNEAGWCQFVINMRGVPLGEGEIYKIEVSGRGEIAFNLEDSESLELTLG